MRFREADIVTQFRVGCRHLLKGIKMTKTSVTAVSRVRFEPGTIGMLPYQPGVKWRDHRACNFLPLPGCDCVLAVLPPPLCACVGMSCGDLKLDPHTSLLYR